MVRSHFTAKSCNARSNVRRLRPCSSTLCEENDKRSVSICSADVSEAVTRCWYGKTCDSFRDVSMRRHGHGASRCQHAGVVCTVCLRFSVFIFLIQINAEKLAAPGMHRHKANASREFAATSERAKNLVSLVRAAVLLRD